MLHEAGAEVTRQDIGADAWTGAPNEAVAWWRGCVAPAGPTEAAPNDVLIKLLRDWDGDASKVALRQLLALLLQRRRVLRPAPTLSLFGGDADSPADAGGVPLRFAVVGGGEPVTVVDCVPERDRLVELQQQLTEIVYGIPASEAAA
ncbi:MAG: hypothetical protein AAFV43_15995 [Planctomycetota bacterium]